jgi:hypothetical protein
VVNLRASSRFSALPVRCGGNVTAKLRGMVIAASTATSMVGLWSSAALAAPTKEQCIGAYEQAQVSIKRGELSKGRDEVRVCLDSACPPKLQADCATWLSDIETKQPTIVVTYVDTKSVRRTDVEVFVDNVSVAKSLDGRAIAVNPGAHTVRIQPAGDAPMEEKYLAREGVKSDAVNFSRAPLAVVGGGGPAPEPTRPIPATVWIAGGVGVVGIASFATFALLGKTAQNDLEACKGRCAEADVKSVKTKYAIADISLAVGAAGLITAGVLYFLRPTATADAAADAAPKAEGNGQYVLRRAAASPRVPSGLWWTPDVAVQTGAQGNGVTFGVTGTMR